MHFLKIRPMVILYRYRRILSPLESISKGNVPPGITISGREIIFLECRLSFFAMYWDYLFRVGTVVLLIGNIYIISTGFACRR